MFHEARRLEIPPEGWTGGLILDEMSIQQDIQETKCGDVIELIGFEDVGHEGNMYSILRRGKADKELGTHALQFMFVGLSGFRFPIAHFITTNVQSYDLHNLFWRAVDKLQLYGFTVSFTCMDGAQSNRSFLHLNLGKTLSSFVAKNPSNPSNPVIFTMDICHCIKKIRNNLMKSGTNAHCTRNIVLPGNKIVQWQMWIDAFEWDQKNALQLHRKLKNDHLYPNQQTKMRNHLAEEVLNVDMLDLMSQYQASLTNKTVLAGPIELLQKTGRMIIIFKDMRPIKNVNDERIPELMEINDWFNKWLNSTQLEDISSKEKSKRVMSYQCHEDVQACLLGFCELCHLVLSNSKTAFVTPALINSDVIENHFCQHRATYNGANTNPTALQYRRNINAIILGQDIISNKANAGKSSENGPAHSYKLYQKSAGKKRTISDDSSVRSIKCKPIRL